MNRAVAAAAGIAVVIAAVLASPASSQEVAGMRFTWEVNLTTVALAAAAVIGWWLTLKRQGDKVADHAKTIAELELNLAKKVEADALQNTQEEIERLQLKTLKLEHEHTALKDEIYKEYLNGAAVREIKNEIRQDIAGTETRVMQAIRDLSDRVDGKKKPP
jgi:hypothetical protein